MRARTALYRSCPSRRRRRPSWSATRHSGLLLFEKQPPALWSRPDMLVRRLDVSRYVSELQARPGPGREHATGATLLRHALQDSSRSRPRDGRASRLAGRRADVTLDSPQAAPAFSAARSFQVRSIDSVRRFQSVELLTARLLLSAVARRVRRSAMHQPPAMPSAVQGHAPRGRPLCVQRAPPADARAVCYTDRTTRLYHKRALRRSRSLRLRALAHGAFVDIDAGMDLSVRLTTCDARERSAMRTLAKSRPWSAVNCLRPAASAPTALAAESCKYTARTRRDPGIIVLPRLRQFHSCAGADIGAHEAGVVVPPARTTCPACATRSDTVPTPVVALLTRRLAIGGGLAFAALLRRRGIDARRDLFAARGAARFLRPRAAVRSAAREIAARASLPRYSRFGERFGAARRGAFGLCARAVAAGRRVRSARAT